MKKKLTLLIFLVSAIIVSLAPGLTMAEDTIGALDNYDNPHDICEYYRGIAANIVRETDNECTVSMFEGEFKIVTQIYYSGNEWCGEVSNNGQVYGKKCIPRKTNTDWDTIYSVVGIMVVLFILIGIINSVGKNKSPAVSSAISNEPGFPGVNSGEQNPSGADNHPTGTVVSAVDEIEKLSKLRNKGILTQNEFEMAKKKLLK